jgi:serine/threonine protein kinase
MSPEMVAGQPYTAQTDIYSLGVIVAELLTSATPAQLHLVPTTHDVAAAPPGALMRWNQLSIWVKGFVMSMLAQVSTQTSSLFLSFLLPSLQSARTPLTAQPLPNFSNTEKCEITSFAKKSSS